MAKKILKPGEASKKPDAGARLASDILVSLTPNIAVLDDYFVKLLDNVNDVIIGTDVNFRITFWSPAAERIFGWRPQEVIGRPTAEILQTEFSPTDRLEAVRTLSESGNWIGEVIQHTKDGRALVFEANIMALSGENGGVTGYLAVNRDITRRHHAEIALQESEARFRNLTENLPDAVYTMELARHKVTYFNHVSFLGYSRDELMTSGSILNQIHPEDMPAVMTHWQQMMRGEAPGNIEYRLQNKAGQWEWIKCREIILSTGADGTPAEVMIILSVVTERKQFEEELRHSKETIEAAHRELQQMHAHEQFLARTDVLTQVSNRRHFFELATHAFAAARRYQLSLSIILFDVDHFKQVNDAFGHQAGDETLQSIAQTASKQLREVDVLARYGGEEFIILLPNTNARQAMALAERVRKGIAGDKIDTTAGGVNVTISVGIADILPEEDTLDRLIQRADKALYAAKEAGRNCTRLFSPAVSG